MHKYHDTSPHFHAARPLAPFHVPYLAISGHRVRSVDWLLSLKTNWVTSMHLDIVSTVFRTQ